MRDTRREQLSWTSNTFPNVTWAHPADGCNLMPGEQGQGRVQVFAPLISLYRPQALSPPAPTPPKTRSKQAIDHETSGT